MSFFTKFEKINSMEKRFYPKNFKVEKKKHLELIGMDAQMKLDIKF